MDWGEWGWLRESTEVFEDARSEFMSSEEELLDAVSEISEVIEPIEITGFFDFLPKESITEVLWPKLIVEDKTKNKCLSQAAHLEQIRTLVVLRRVCKGWYGYVSETYEWEYGVLNYIENYLSLEFVGEEESSDSSW
jgi:hypothetical protein